VSEELLKALDEATYQLFSAYRMLDAICENDEADPLGVSADRIKARDNAWDAYMAATKTRHAHRLAREVKP
jgi:hypothetical protein